MENPNNSIPYLDSDRCTTSYGSYGDTYFDSSYYYLYQQAFPLCMDLSLQFIIMSFGLYGLKLATTTSFFSQKLVSITSNKMTVIVFWSIFTILLVINMTIFCNETLQMSINWWIFSFHLKTFISYLLPFVFMILEIFILLFCLSKHIILSSRVCCISKIWIVRVIYSFAILNIFWFAHCVGKCFLISMCFIAIAPATTLAVITLLVSVIVISIVATSSVAYVCFLSNSRRCAKMCNVFILFFMIHFLIIFVSIFSLIFVEFTNHGLSATSLGTIILSLTIPAIVFIVSRFVKKYLKKVSFHNNDDSNNSINNEQRTMENQSLLGDN